MTERFVFIASAFSLFILCFGFYILFFRRRVFFSEQELSDIRSRFADLEKRVYWDPRYVVLEGDKLLELLLKRCKFRGSVGDMLKKADSLFPNIQQLWDAHKLRNLVAHALDVRIEPNQAKKAIVAFRRAYSTFGLSV
jgi:hypothetical protein